MPFGQNSDCLLECRHLETARLENANLRATAGSSNFRRSASSQLLGDASKRFAECLDGHNHDGASHSTHRQGDMGVSNESGKVCRLDELFHVFRANRSQRRCWPILSRTLRFPAAWNLNRSELDRGTSLLERIGQTSKRNASRKRISEVCLCEHTREME